MESELVGFGVAILLGALIGLQREHLQQKSDTEEFAGFRTFILVTFLGATLGYLSDDFSSWPVITGFLGVFLFVIVSYVLTYIKARMIGMTTEFAMVISYIVGAMCLLGYLKIAIVLGILTVSFLAFKDKFHLMAKKINSREIVAIVKFGLVALVVLPFLPNRNFSLGEMPGLSDVLFYFGMSHEVLRQLDFFNPYIIWLMVVFVSGISFLGYVLVKLFGEKRGYAMIGFLGGLASSTAVTLSMASKSKRSKLIVYPFVLAVVIATSTTFIRVLFEVAVVNPSLLKFLVVPMIVMSVFGFLISFLFLRKERKHNKKEAGKFELDQPFALVPAIKFGVFFFLILALIKISQIFFGSVGLYITSILSGLADVDAIVLSVSSLAKTGKVAGDVAAKSIILAVGANTLVKGLMAYYLGGKMFGRMVLGIFLGVLVVGGISLMLI